MSAPEWYPAEYEAWALAESVRQGFVREPRLKKREDLLAKVASTNNWARWWNNLRIAWHGYVRTMGTILVWRIALR
jgi:hypothetical protein